MEDPCYPFRSLLALWVVSWSLFIDRSALGYCTHIADSTAMSGESPFQRHVAQWGFGKNQTTGS